MQIRGDVVGIVLDPADAAVPRAGLTAFARLRILLTRLEIGRVVNRYTPLFLRYYRISHTGPFQHNLWSSLATTPLCL
jgi:hypothetical protein